MTHCYAIRVIRDRRTVRWVSCDEDTAGEELVPAVRRHEMDLYVAGTFFPHAVHHFREGALYGPSG